MKLKIKNFWLCLLFFSVILARYYFYQIDDCFSDFCRHSKNLSIEDGSNRVEVLPFFIHQSYPFLLYFFDLPALFLVLFSRKIINFIKVILCVWAAQPSYDIMFLITVALSLSFYRLKILSFLTAFWIKTEMFILIVIITFSYWVPLARFKIKGNITFISIICSLSLVVASIVDFTIISGPPNGKFQGFGNTIIRFFGYIFMPITSIISYKVESGLHENIIRIQSIILSALFFYKLINKQFLANYILVCAGLAIIIYFYQLRYPLTVISVYCLYMATRTLPNIGSTSVIVRKDAQRIARRKVSVPV